MEERMCKCERCTSYPGCAADGGLLVFCRKGKAPCQVTMRGCLCSSCKVQEMYGLTREYHCLQGTEKGRI